ncbi:alkyl sulfatase dimerization domain-containing protein [Pseudomonas sp. TMP25]|uniref:alkyl/aryl-sulfatase n=1 Tax=Pseudomonas sp. TMP25 TaxID=3136561 RepID=UPI003101773B
MTMRVPFVLTLLCVSLLAGCDQQVPRSDDADAAGFTAPTSATLAAQAETAKSLPADDGLDLQEAERGLIAREDSLSIAGANGRVLFDQDAYRFIQGAAPGSVNPSLWRQAQLNNHHGLYKVTEGVYQLRGYDLAVMSLIDSKNGWIVVDPLTTVETASRAMAFARKTLGDKPVVAVIFTHSHVDHFGGALAVASAADVASGKVRVYAPQGFMEEATSENVLAGPAMGRRAIYMYGRDLPRSERGKVDNGLGKEPAMGTVGILQPTDLIDSTPQAVAIDGVDFIFQYTPGAEAPAEMTFYLPAHKAFGGAEILSRTLHNLYTLRGAKVRDARLWAGYIDASRQDNTQAEVMFFSHHWPVWGQERIDALMREQRDTFSYIHDQTLRLANQGYGPREIAEQLTLPKSLQTHYWNRGYYGTLKHNVKGVYQMYFGWYDANPANLDPLPRLEGAKQYVEYMGGSAAILEKAQVSFDKGEYRWLAEVLNQLVSAEPENTQAKALLARSYDQLGYRAESSAWRNAYLTAAFELRHGAPEFGVDVAAAGDLLEQTSGAQFMQMFQVALNGPKAEGVDLRLNITFSDLQENYVLSIENAVLQAHQAPVDSAASATLTLTRALLVKIITQQAGIKELLTSEDMQVDGSMLDLARFFSLLDKPDQVFPIVTGKP